MDEMDNIAQYPIYFAPGCKMLQLEPVLTSQLYDYLHQLFGKIQLYTRCCVFDDARTHDEEAVFITICPTCFSIYGETYANLHMRDFGVLPSAQDAFLLDLGLQTLPVRMKQHCENA